MTGPAPLWRAHPAAFVRASRSRLFPIGLIGAMSLGYWSCAGIPAPTAVPPASSLPPVAATSPSPTTVETVESEPEPEPPAPVLNEAALAARTAAQRRLLGSDVFEDERGRPLRPTMPADDPPQTLHAIDDQQLDTLPGSSGLAPPPTDVAVSPTDPTASATTTSTRPIDGNTLGSFVPIEGEREAISPLAQFYAALDRLARGEDTDGKVRVLIYGGSHTDADIYPQYIRSYLQHRFGDGGHGFIHVAKPWRWYRHADYRVQGGQYWTTEHAQRRKGRMDGLYGFMGTSLSGRSRRAEGHIIPRGDAVGSIYELFFLRQPKGGSVELLVDGQRQTIVKTRSDQIEPGYHRFTLPEGQHRIKLKLRGDGEVRLFGMTVEREQPGIVVDTLGIGGTRAANMLQWNQDIWADNLMHRDPDLVMFFYGTNEATDEDQPIEVYQHNLHTVLERMATMAPHASCLLMGPGDFPLQQEDGTWVNRPRIDAIIAVQRRVAAEHGCGFWDTKAFMGGELSMPMWAHAEPSMAKNDYIHFTKRGYVRIGMAVVDAMMVDFDRTSTSPE